MKNSFKAFMGGIIDYAGMFPTAFLNLEEAFTNYSKYLKSKDNWMLAGFVCRPSDLTDLIKLLEKEKMENKLKLSILLNNSGKSDMMISSVKRDVNQIKNFQSFYQNVDLFSFEIRLPESVTVNAKKTADTVFEILNVLSYEFYEYKVFFETFVIDKNWRSYIENVNAVLEITNADTGLKLRTGGLEPKLFPEAEKIAYIVKASNYHKLPLKATAGLQHPVTHFNTEVKAKMYGFLNIFGAILLNHKHNLSINSLMEIINDESPKSFKFTKDEFIYKEYSMTSEEITEARKYGYSFGSFSFDEPREDLKKLKLL